MPFTFALCILQSVISFLISSQSSCVFSTSRSLSLIISSADFRIFFIVDSVKTTSTGNTVPIVATQEAESSILVKDGVTIVMGGLIQERTLKTTSKIPFLGDIPILGIPFRKLIKEVDKTELVLFLTPTIVQGDRNFYDDDSVIVGDDVKEIFEQATPEFYTNPIKKTKRFLKDEFLAE